MNRLWLSLGIFILPSFFLFTCTPQTPGTSSSSSEQSTKTLQIDDNIYEDRIKTVQFYPVGASATSILNPPIVERSQSSSLMIEFDDLGKDYCNYYAKIYHYNANWTRSNYTDLQLVSDFNEYLLQDYAASINTKVRYTHYRFRLPKVKITGNYLLLIYRNGDINDVVISRKYVVFDPILEITTNVQFATNVSDRDEKQQVDFTIAYGTYDIPNPQDVRVVVRQNHRWENAITLKEPMYIKYDKKLLDYTFFDGRNTFEGGNEFRFFDIRNLRTRGMNVQTYATSDTNNSIMLVEDLNRNSRTYSEQIDINGKYVIQRAESQDAATEADYANVFFRLNVPPDFKGNIYLSGQMTDWKLKPRYKMDYDTASGLFVKNLLLKQGFYNYQYCLVDGNRTDKNYFEGNYNLTENFYDIIVYYRPANQFNDIVIGYKAVNYRGRN